ncbi:MAG: diguanylate cyclase [Oscillibacter sp.]
MKNPIRWTASTLIKCAAGCVILLGIVLITVVNEHSFTKVVNDDIVHISKLSSAMISAQIDDSLSAPIFVGQTMAGDSFLRDWLANEVGDAQDAAKMQRYLAAYRDQYHYHSAFVVSAGSGIYYCQDGINKKISPEDAHDVWYYDFVESGKAYDLDVDVDEVSGDVLTVFVNCRITDPAGTFLGVAGVGIKMSSLQDLLNVHEREYDMEAFLMDETGLIQVDSTAGAIETANFFDRPKAQTVREEILNNKTSTELFWNADHGSGYCLVTQYIEKLDWYLVVEKNTQVVRELLDAQMRQTLLLTFFIIAVVLLVVSKLLGKYSRGLVRAASIDGVTGLPNNKMFRQFFNQNMGRPGFTRGRLFMFDIDDFKSINDTYGHLSGNAVLNRVSRVAKATIGEDGIVARWGGDEFVGMVYGNGMRTEEIVREIGQKIAAIRDLDCPLVTVSIGMTAMSARSTLSKLLHEADTAMYAAKKQGKNKTVLYQELSELSDK